MTMLSEALDYAKRGWYVFPCRERPGEPYKRGEELYTPVEKTPYTRNGLDDATIEETQIREWWGKWPEALIGINAGKSGLFVIDIDRKHVNGLDTYSSWNINDSGGLHSITPSGGMHVVFSGQGKTSTNAKTGVDTRGAGGYFIAPPSKIYKGDYIGEYKRFDDWGRVPGVIPDGLMPKLFPEKPVEYLRNPSSAINGESTKELSRATLKFLVDGAIEGERNEKLFKVLADFAGCGYTMEKAREVVFPISQRINFPKEEFETVLLHAYSKERTSSIPQSIQEKISLHGKDVAGKISTEEQTIMENFLLAALLKNNTLIPAIQDILEYDDFQIFKNKVIYKAINRLYDMGLACNILSVSGEVKVETSKVTLDDISKIYYSKENETLLTEDNAVTYAKILRERATMRKLESILDNKENYFKDISVAKIVANIEKDIADVAIYGGVKSTSVIDSVQAIEVLNDRTRKVMNGELPQLKTGFADFDNVVGGFYSNEMIICAGRPGDGKSALALTIANYVSIKNKNPSLFFSLEMPTRNTLLRLLCQLTGLPFNRMYNGNLSQDEWARFGEAQERIKSSPMYFDDSFGITLPELRSKIRREVETHDIRMVVIDQLEQISGFDSLPAYQKFDRIAYSIKSFTEEFDIPIILNHQLNRNVTDRKYKDAEPQASDLNQAGEKPADQIWIIHHKKDEDGNNLNSKIKIVKNRNGMIMEFPVTFVKDRVMFASILDPRDREEWERINAQTKGDGDSPYWANG
jgi:replicative DNA helicase